MRHLVLVHTGTTEYDKQGRIQGTLDVPLSAEGLQQIGDLVDELRGLKPTALFTAPGQASQETSDLLGAELRLKPRTLDKLTNVNQGLWQGLLVDEVKTKQPKVFRQWLEHPETVCPPEGESISVVRARVADVLTRLMKKVKPDTAALLVAPDPLASVIREQLSGADLGDLWHANGQAGRWESFELDKPAEVEVGG